MIGEQRRVNHRSRMSRKTITYAGTTKDKLITNEPTTDIKSRRDGSIKRDSRQEAYPTTTTTKWKQKRGKRNGTRLPKSQSSQQKMQREWNRITKSKHWRIGEQRGNRATLMKADAHQTTPRTRNQMRGSNNATSKDEGANMSKD